MLKPLRYMVGGPSEVYASSGAAFFCAGMNPLPLKNLLKGCLLVAFFENPPVLPFLIKRAALGNLKVNFLCAHLHSSPVRGLRIYTPQYNKVRPYLLGLVMEVLVYASP